MYLVQGISTYPLQNQNLTLPDSTTVSIQLYFIPMQSGWFINNLTYGTFVLNGLRITNNPNILYQYKNIIPFGLACYSTNNREPSLQQDFASGASKLYILDSAEVAAYTEFLQSGVS